MALEMRLDELLQSWEDKRRQGEAVTAEEICHECPDLVDELKRRMQAKIEAGDPSVEPHATTPVPPILLANRAAQLTPLDISGNTADPQQASRQSLALAPGLEPVPGYLLVELLGRGGFGEAWKARGPGGFPVALKFLRVGEGIAVPEVRSLTFLKDIRHANLLSVFGAWQNDDYIIIAMELADRTLLDRSRQHTSSGQSGIPFQELIDYIYDAAKGIDYLNEPRHELDGKSGVSIQHRDIKPHNLFLVGGSVKVGDFGLARVLEQNWTQHSGSMTPAYAAPEFFQGQTSDRSDQYSLAVTYCHLRGGRLPFGGNIAQITAGHLLHPPNLTMLPASERPVVAKALAKKPPDRWPSCRAFVRALAAAEGEPTSARMLIPTPPQGPTMEQADLEAAAAAIAVPPTARPIKPPSAVPPSGHWKKVRPLAPPTPPEGRPAVAPPTSAKSSGRNKALKLHSPPPTPVATPAATDARPASPPATDHASEPAASGPAPGQPKSIRLVRQSPSDRIRERQEQSDRFRSKLNLIVLVAAATLLPIASYWIWLYVWQMWLK
jgi:serine/threonine protein kinase